MNKRQKQKVENNKVEIEEIGSSRLERKKKRDRN